MIIKYEDLKKIRKENSNKKIVICAGWFDMFHIGHLKFLNNAKRNGDILIVVVMNDIGIKPLKGSDRPIISEEDRINIIDNIKAVDYSILSTKHLDINDYKDYKITSDYKEKLLWEEYLPIIFEVNADIIFSLNETLNYNSMRKIFNEKNINIIYTEYTKGISTTGLLEKLNI